MEIASVIKYEGDNSTFIWKHPKEDFNINSQLIVHETQEAIFFANGQALDTFGPGRHTLKSENIPLIRNFYHLLTGDAPFHCEVYFINKAYLMAIKWGTDSKVQYLEPEYGFPIEIGACGEMCLQVENGRKLLLKLVGTTKGFTKDDLSKYFRAFLMIKIKPYLARVIKNQNISIFEIDSYIDFLSSELHVLVKSDFEEFGIKVDKFFLTTIVKPDGESTYEKFKNLHFKKFADVAEAELQQKIEIIDQTTEAQKRIIEAQSMAQKRQIEGYTYQEERSFDVASKLVQNEGVGEFTNAGIGLGMISGIGTSMGNMTNCMFATSMSSFNGEEKPTVGIHFCVQCGNSISEGMKFCANCGKSLTNNCTNCGSEIPEGGKFCPKCGAKRGDM